MANSGYKSISRIDHPKKDTHGWYVRVHFKGVTYPKFFSDAQFDGPQDALEAALDWRDETERDLGKPRSERPLVLLSPRNQTGIIGVRRARKAGHVVYEVSWCPVAGQLQRTSISIDKYGEAEAYRRAVALRKAREREMFGAELPTTVGRKRNHNGSDPSA